jgi:hypothetical protein
MDLFYVENKEKTQSETDIHLTISREKCQLGKVGELIEELGFQSEVQ